MCRTLPALFALTLAAALGGCAASGPLDLSSGSAQTQDVAHAAGVAPPARDELAEAKAAFRARDFGLAEQRFRAVVSSAPDNAEAWLGLAATYDELRRFDLADEGYRQVTRIAGDTVALRNNRGYSYLMRRRYREARRDFLAAQARDPQNPFVAANLRLLAQRGRNAGL